MNLTDKITINTQSSIKVSLENKTIYFDPFKIQEEVHDADIVFITHAHFDHFSAGDLEKVISEKTTLVIPESLKEKLGELEGPADEVIMVNPGDKLNVCGVPCEVVYSYNTNKPNHLIEYKWVGYVVELLGERMYVAGDTDVIPEIEEIKCDIALVPIGGTYTMDLYEAADYVNKIHPDTVIPIHYGSVVGKEEMGLEFAKLINPDINVVIKLEFVEIWQKQR